MRSRIWGSDVGLYEPEAAAPPNLPRDRGLLASVANGRDPDQTHSRSSGADPEKNLLTVAGKATAGVGLPPITAGAESGSKKASLPAWAEKPACPPRREDRREGSAGGSGKGLLSAESAIEFKGRAHRELVSRRRKAIIVSNPAVRLCRHSPLTHFCMACLRAADSCQIVLFAS